MSELWPVGLLFTENFQFLVAKFSIYFSVGVTKLMKQNTGLNGDLKPE